MFFKTYITNSVPQALWLLANNTHIQSKLREELVPIFTEGSRPDYRTLRDLKMLDCVMCVPYPVVIHGFSPLIRCTLVQHGKPSRSAACTNDLTPGWEECLDRWFMGSKGHNLLHPCVSPAFPFYL